MAARRFRVEWPSASGSVVAVEPTPEELRARALELAAAYNEAHNRVMLANTIDFSEADVLAHYAAMAEEGARQFFLYDGAGVFVGDADFRRLEGDAGEFAILIAARARQGKGLGTRLTTLLHVLAFQALGLERVYVTILPSNVASRRLFEKIGYAPDPSPAARVYADEADDVSMSIGKANFARAHPVALAEVRITEA